MGRVRRTIATCAGALLVLWAVWLGQAQASDDPDLYLLRSGLRRTLREYVFFSGQVGLRQRAVAYAEGAVDGPGGKSDFRAHVNASLANGGDPLFGAFIGSTLIFRGPGPTAADPLASPYDDFEFRRNVRLRNAYAQFALRDANGREQVRIRAGRLVNFDGRRNLLTFDGASAATRLGILAASASAGRRVVFDGTFPDQRGGLSGFVAQGALEAELTEEIRVRAGYGFDEVHRPNARVIVAPSDTFDFQVSVEAWLGGEDALGDGERQGGEARTSVHWASGDHRTVLDVFAAAQWGENPAPYGRGGRGPSAAEVAAAAQLGVISQRLDRLFLGTIPAHGTAEAVFSQWLSDAFTLQLGTYGVLPWKSEDQRSLRPALIEFWIAPELILRAGSVGAEVRLIREDPGEPTTIFSGVGDGERALGSARVFGEVPVVLSESVRMSLRAEVEGSYWDTRGPLSLTENQLGYFAGADAVLHLQDQLRLAFRYGVGGLPSIGTDGVDAIHNVEVWVGGRF